jgi:hypothetical protein
MVDFRADRERQLADFVAHIVGNPLASLVAVKGTPGAFERDGGAPFSGADGLALDKAFGRLGWGYGSQDTRIWFGILLSLPSGPLLSARELRLICEIVDPLTIVALDDTARLALIDAFASTEKALATTFALGAESAALGRQLVSVEGFEDALADANAKQKAWTQLKRCVFSPSRT